MYAIEFETKIKNGTIDIPEQYRNRFKTRVRVILMVEEETSTTHFIDELLENPRKVSDFQPMTREEIYECV
jgi:hypothetical protein